MTDYRVVLVTCPSLEEAEKIARRAVEEKLAACVNISSRVISVFWWENKVERAEEVFLVIKTKKNKIERLIDLVKKTHSYQVPEIISLPVTEGSKNYLEWIEKVIEH